MRFLNRALSLTLATSMFATAAFATTNFAEQSAQEEISRLELEITTQQNMTVEEFSNKIRGLSLGTKNELIDQQIDMYQRMISDYESQLVLTKENQEAIARNEKWVRVSRNTQFWGFVGLEVSIVGLLGGAGYAITMSEKAKNATVFSLLGADAFYQYGEQRAYGKLVAEQKRLNQLASVGRGVSLLSLMIPMVAYGVHRYAENQVQAVELSLTYQQAVKMIGVYRNSISALESLKTALAAEDLANQAAAELN